MNGSAVLLLLTLDELATVLRVSRKQVYAWTRDRTRNGIPRIKAGRGYRFILDDVLAWLREFRDPRVQLVSARGNGSAASPGRPRGVRARRRRRAPNKPLGGRRAATLTAASVSADGPASVAAPLPNETAEGTHGT